MTGSIEVKVIEIIAQQAVLNVSDLSSESKPDELGIDSIGLVECIFAIEETFDIRVPYNANDPAEGGFDLTSVGSISKAVETLIRTSAEA